jgi:hypothetical protein
MPENPSNNDNGLSDLLWTGGAFLAGLVSGWLEREFGDNVVSQIMDNVVAGMTGGDSES